MSRNKEHRGAAFGGAPIGSVFSVSAHLFFYIMNTYGYSLYIPYIFHIYIYVLNMFHVFSLVCILKIMNLFGKTYDFVKRSQIISLLNKRFDFIKDDKFANINWIGVIYEKKTENTALLTRTCPPGLALAGPDMFKSRLLIKCHTSRVQK